MKDYLAYLIQWVEQQRQDYNALGYVIGISGGIDSAVVSHLLMRTGAPVQGLLLPSATTSTQDVEDAKLVAESAKCPLLTLPITPLYECFMDSMSPLFNQNAQHQAVIKGNVQARLRMLALYAYAQSHQAIVVGTDNAAEWFTGYFTKFGDGGVDIAPLLALRKEQVYELARLLNVPQQILTKAPSAGLWEGQTDEQEMGVTYQEIDAFLRGEPISAQGRKQIDFWHQRSRHKRRLPTSPVKPKLP
ncbi:NAD(+) synthase [Avibacterium sp. 20-15]|uniref:NAD(+) synthase n=1 Tax=unclassified Avibacterium TaxID=2685287 RepID=UPI00202618C2|nr:MULTISPECIES: NAD(+) synthase [unclassified Avibacterium]MCW9732904.1 NAD(+) synthase [Avibacterium sp. 20-15]URL05039.1 NAD(+) synthase [Avibacterium sp. 20-132]